MNAGPARPAQASRRSIWNFFAHRRVTGRSAAAASTVSMNQHVMRAGKSVHSDEGLVLTDVRPFADIPTVWRFGAMVATLLMGLLALVAALYFGRTVLLPVIAALIVGITLSPAVKIGS